MKKIINKNIISYIVLIGSIIGSFFFKSDIVKIFPMMFFLIYICIQEFLLYKNVERVDLAYKKDIQKQIEVLKTEINKINLKFFNMR